MVPKKELLVWVMQSLSLAHALPTRVNGRHDPIAEFAEEQYDTDGSQSHEPPPNRTPGVQALQKRVKLPTWTHHGVVSGQFPD